MVFTKTRFNVLSAGQLPLTPYEPPEMLKRNRLESCKRAHKRLKERTIKERPREVHERNEIGHW